MKKSRSKTKTKTRSRQRQRSKSKRSKSKPKRRLSSRRHNNIKRIFGNLSFFNDIKTFETKKEIEQKRVPPIKTPLIKTPITPEHDEFGSDSNLDEYDSDEYESGQSSPYSPGRETFFDNLMKNLTKASMPDEPIMYRTYEYLKYISDSIKKTKKMYPSTEFLEKDQKFEDDIYQAKILLENFKEDPLFKQIIGPYEPTSPLPRDFRTPRSQLPPLSERSSPVSPLLPFHLDLVYSYLSDILVTIDSYKKENHIFTKEDELFEGHILAAKEYIRNETTPVTSPVSAPNRLATSPVTPPNQFTLGRANLKKVTTNTKKIQTIENTDFAKKLSSRRKGVGSPTTPDSDEGWSSNLMSFQNP